MASGFSVSARASWRRDGMAWPLGGNGTVCHVRLPHGRHHLHELREPPTAHAGGRRNRRNGADLSRRAATAQPPAALIGQVSNVPIEVVRARVTVSGRACDENRARGGGRGRSIAAFSAAVAPTLRVRVHGVERSSHPRRSIWAGTRRATGPGAPSYVHLWLVGAFAGCTRATNRRRIHATPRDVPPAAIAGRRARRRGGASAGSCGAGRRAAEHSLDLAASLLLIHCRVYLGRDDRHLPIDEPIVMEQRIWSTRGSAS